MLLVLCYLYGLHDFVEIVDGAFNILFMELIVRTERTLPNTRYCS